MRKRIASFVVLLLAFCFVIAGCAQKNGNAESKNADREQASISSSDDTQNVSDSSNRAESNTDSTIANAPNDIYAKSAWTAVQYSETSDGNYEDVMSIYCGVALFFDEGRATLITYDMQTEFGYTINTDGFTSPIGKTSMDAIIDNDSMTLKMLGHTWIMERTDISDAISYARTMVGPDYSGIPFDNEDSDSITNSVAWLECTDNETVAGYSLRKELKISQWISENDSELLSAAWNEVGSGKAFPSTQSMGFNGNYISNNGKTWIDYDEIYYAVGSLDVWNETDGWDITKDNTLDISIYLYGANRYMTMTLLYSNASKKHYSVANGVFGTQGGGWSPITGKMQSNHWGSVPFVIAFAIDRTPEYPDGNPSILDCTFRFGDSTFTLVPSADDGEKTESGNTYPEGLSHPLIYAQPFSEGLTWIKYNDETAEVQTAAMNADGDILFTLTESAEYLSDFHDNTAFYTVADTSTDVLIDASGNELYRTCGNAENTVKQERICGYANGAYILVRQESGISEKTNKVALMNPDGTMKMDYTNQFTSVDMYASAVDLINSLFYENTAHYRGEGWYQIGSTFINFDEMKIGRISYQTVVSNFLSSGVLVAVDHTGMRCYDTNLNSVSFTVSVFPHEMHDGMFFRNTYNFDTKEYEAGYYDENLNLVRSTALYPDNQVYCSPFSDGLAIMEITGKDGNTYLTMIDSTGEQMFEPVIIDDYYPRVLDGYAIIQTEDVLWLMDSNGNLVHSMTSDLPNCAISIDSFLDFQEGYLLLKYTHDGKQYYRLYPVGSAVSAGSDIYDLGVLTLD